MNEKTLEVGLGERSYKIHIAQNILDTIGERIKQFGFPLRTVLISNPHLINLYGERLILSLKKNGFETEVIKVPEGEKYKNLKEAVKIYERLLLSKFDRYSPLIALGGGVIGDLAGFVAATYMRGVPYIQIPTSLLAQVDSSVGGKTAVNHRLGKNMIGAFYQPKGVYIDLHFLNTLPDIEFRCGMAEIIKYGIIADANLFNFLDDSIEKIKDKDVESLRFIIESSCGIKAKIVSEDEKEKNIRAILNFGHTIGHALESLTRYSKYKHGEAVSIGMVAAAYISHAIGLCAKKDVDRVKDLIASFGLPTQLPDINIEKILKTLYYDKKIRDNKVKLILMKTPGSVEIRDDIPDKIIVTALTSLSKAKN